MSKLLPPGAIRVCIVHCEVNVLHVCDGLGWDIVMDDAGSLQFRMLVCDGTLLSCPHVLGVGNERQCTSLDQVDWQHPKTATAAKGIERP